MVFGYYSRLDAKGKRIYKQSDKVSAIQLPDAEALQPLVNKMRVALEAGSQERTQKWGQQLLHTLADQFDVRRIRLKVLDIRPSSSREELHALYYPREERGLPHMKLWMRTAKRHQVVAFKTFLRTLLHEFCHHLDYEYLGLKDSFHTEGFYKRESSLVHQVLQLSSSQSSGIKNSAKVRNVKGKK